MQIRGTYALVTKGKLLGTLLESKCVPSLIQQILLRKGKELQHKYSLPADVDILKDVVCYIYCSRGGLTNHELITLLTDKYPLLKDFSKTWTSINYENELPYILCYRLDMLTFEHKFVFDAIERTYILKDHLFSELADQLKTDLLIKIDLENKIA